MGLLNFAKKDTQAPEGNIELESFLKDFSIEVMPRTAEKIENFRDLLPIGTTVYIAHLEDTPIEDMVITAKRIAAEGFDVMPHFPARIIKNKQTLRDMIFTDVGNANRPGAFISRQNIGVSINLLDTVSFEIDTNKGAWKEAIFTIMFKKQI